MNKQYKFWYSVEGINHTPWYPNYICWGRTMKEARKRALEELNIDWKKRLGMREKIHIITGARYDVIDGNFDKYIFPVIKHTSNLRKVITANSMKTKPRRKSLTELILMTDFKSKPNNEIRYRGAQRHRCLN